MNNTSMPNEPLAAVASLEAWLDEATRDDVRIDKSVAALLADLYDLTEHDVRARLHDHPVLDWIVDVTADWECESGDGWGSYFGPTPDEHYGRITVLVCDPDGTPVWDDCGSAEDLSGGVAVMYLTNQFDCPEMHKVWGTVPTQGA